MTSFWENGQKPNFWAFYNIFTGMLKACQIFRHKPLAPNYKVNWSLSLCKNLEQSDNYFWRKWPKTLFSAFYDIFTGMPKACQIFPTQTTYAKSLSSLASIILQKIKTILWPVFEKMTKNLIFGHFTTFLRACPRRVRFSGINRLRQIIKSIGLYHYAKF